jgi:hypothetical protein
MKYDNPGVYCNDINLLVFGSVGVNNNCCSVEIGPKISSNGSFPSLSVAGGVKTETEL